MEIIVNRLWQYSTGQYCAEVDVNGKRVASVYTPEAERLIVGAYSKDASTRIWMEKRGRDRQPWKSAGAH